MEGASRFEHPRWPNDDLPGGPLEHSEIIFYLRVKRRRLGSSHTENPSPSAKRWLISLACLRSGRQYLRPHVLRPRQKLKGRKRSWKNRAVQVYIYLFLTPKKDCNIITTVTASSRPSSDARTYPLRSISFLPAEPHYLCTRWILYN